METHREENHVKTEEETSKGTPRVVSNHQKLEEARKDSSLEPAEGAWPFQQLDFGLTASRTTREQMSVVTLFMVICYSGPRK